MRRPQHLRHGRKTSQTIWVQSPCTLAYCIKNLPPLQKAQRFHYNSIYYKDDPFKPATKVNQFQKPDLLLNEFRRNIKDVEISLKRSSADKKSSHRSKSRYDDSKIEENERNSFHSIEWDIVNRLCPKKPRLVKLEYDLYGNRSSFVEEEDPKRFSHKSISSKKIGEHSRSKLSRPQNFNPGPGSYFVSTNKGHPKKKGFEQLSNASLLASKTGK